MTARTPVRTRVPHTRVTRTCLPGTAVRVLALALAPAVVLLLTGWGEATSHGPGLVLVAATALAAMLARLHALRLARPAPGAAGSRVHAGAGSGLTADGGPPRQRDPDAPGRCRPRAPGHLG